MALYLTVASRNLVQARRRTLLLGAALALVTLLLVLLQALSQGLTDNMIRSATTLSTGHVNVGGFFKATPADASPIVTNATEIRKIVEENTPGLAYVIDRGRGWAKVVSDSSSVFAGLAAVDAAQETRLRDSLILASEDSYKEGGSTERKGDLSKVGTPGSILLFAGQAKKLGIGVGDSITITAQNGRGVNNSAEATVVAVCEDIGMLSMWTMFVPKQLVLDLYQLKQDTTGAVQIYLTDIRQADQVMAHLRDVFKAKGYRLMDHDAQPFFAKFPSVSGEDWLGQKLDITTWSDEVSFLTKMIAGFNTVSFMLIGILMVIIVVGIMNTMWISVRERTGEIGTLRAIGMLRSRVLTMFLTEAMLLGAGATVVGALVGAAVVTGLNAAQIKITTEAVRVVLLSDKLHLALTPGQLVGAVLGFTLVTALASLWPALRAARMQPVTAIQSVQ